MQGKTHLAIGAAAGLASAIVAAANDDWQTLAAGAALGGLAGWGARLLLALAVMVYRGA